MKSIISYLTGAKIAKKITNVLFNKMERDEIERLILLEEAKLGAEIFGDRKPGYRRDFFMLDKKTWVWNEQVDTPDGSHIVTTRYVVRDGAIYKTQDGGPYELLMGEELENLHSAITIYTHKVRRLYATL